LDGSVVYGSDKARQSELRTLDGTGHLKTSAGNLMMFNVNGLPNQPPADRGLDPGLFFLGGDVRSNENLALSTMQNLLVREHNFWADSIKAGDPTLTDDGIYQRARAFLVAEIQLITYRDFIPILLGPNALAPYTGYKSTVDPRVSLAFSTAGFRVGHTFLPPVISRLDTKNRSIGDVTLDKALFAPQFITKIGIEPYLRGLARQIPQEVDVSIVDGVRNFFTGIGTGFDLPALNIQRGRDHGLPSYNQVRIDYGLAPKASFAEVTSNPDFQSRLASAYSSPDDMDLWVGCLAEDHVNGGLVGETMWTIFKDQFERTRDGDRFWYESYLDPTTLAIVQQQTLGAIIKRDTSIGSEMQDEVFHVPPQ
ncbi:MAG: peroxidase family protein, partial [Chthoniobacterales bacterium]